MIMNDASAHIKRSFRIFILRIPLLCCMLFLKVLYYLLYWNFYKTITTHLSKTSVSTLEMMKDVVYSINIKITLYFFYIEQKVVDEYSWRTKLYFPLVHSSSFLPLTDTYIRLFFSLLAEQRMTKGHFMAFFLTRLSSYGHASRPSEIFTRIRWLPFIE
jgi:hypothetical protein